MPSPRSKDERIPIEFQATMVPLEITATSELNKEQKSQILKIWNREYPEFLVHSSDRDFDSYLEKLENARHFIAKSQNEIIGWISIFDRDGEKWFVTLVSSHMQNRGVGAYLIKNIKNSSEVLNGWVIECDSHRKANGERYKSPLIFYEKNGFKKTKDRFSNNDFEAVKIQWSSHVSQSTDTRSL